MNFTRLISLTPSITETICALGAGKRLAGVTDACDYPPEVNTKPHVCSWFAPDMDRLLALEPDLVLGLASAHAGLVPVLQEKDIHTVLFDPQTIADVLADIGHLGELLSAEDAAQSLVEKLRQRLAKLDAAVRQIPPEERLTVARVLDADKDELIVAGPRSFQYDVIGRAGGINVTTSYDAAYPRVSFIRLKEWDPAMIFICGTDANYISRLKADPQWQTLAAVREDMLYQFDCGLTCRTSPRIVDMAELLFRTLYGG